jgi:tetratricopeptide (TPR) repeat protein
MADALQQAIEDHKAGRLAEAEAVYRKFLAQSPNDPRLLHMLGTALLQRRQFGEAIPLLQRAAAAAPNVAETQFALGDAMRFTGQFADAEAAYRRAIAIRPLFPSAHNALGLALVQQNKLESASLAWRRAIQLRPDYAEAHANLGAALAQQQRPREASEVLRKAVELNPNFAPAHNNLANVLDELEETDEAIVHWTRAIELAPNYFDALLNLAKAIAQRGELTRALELLDRAVQVRPDDADARFLRGMQLLLLGDFPRGLADYRFRGDVRGVNLAARSFPQPLWDGRQSLSGKTLLLHTEQGLGDTIQFVRYAPLLADRRATVLLESPAELATLLTSVAGVAEVIARGQPLPPFDLHASLANLPMLMGTTLETIPADVPYLMPAGERVDAWQALLAGDPPGRRIGLVWSGNPKHTNDQRRSIPLRQFEMLADVRNATFFSLQKGAAGTQVTDATLHLKLVDHTPRLTDFHETAAMISHLDLVITVDTSVAHLAGAMNKPVWILLPFVPDWRWLLNRADSPWYPSARLFRQPKWGDWDSVVAAVAEALRE